MTTNILYQSQELEIGQPICKIGNVLEDPEIDFTSLAKAFGCYGFGPYTRPSELEEAIREAAMVTIRERKPVVVDIRIEDIHIESHATK
jgi:Thiamine pyrophosphate-requiring enzymes [acetolactate synthase, pyruvate dehydrogenase (cytochrome), glyoxylate carboligase, phosphonopyruvate decarboxylase]